MPFQKQQFTGETLELFAAAETAIGQVPPAFALAATVAVNPFLGQVGEGRAVAAARLRRVAGQRLTRDRATFARMIAEGRIGPDHLAAAAAAAGLAPAALTEGASRPAPPLVPEPCIADLAHRATGIDWPGLIEDRVGLWAAAHFDEGQALWPAPGGTPFASWRACATRDLTTAIAGLEGFAARVAALPDNAQAAFALTCDAIGIAPAAAPLYFHRLLTTLGGWAQFARSRGWIAARDGDRDDTAFALLAIRLVWEEALLDHFRDRIAGDWARAQEAWAAPPVPSRDDLVDVALQDAADRAEEARLAATFAAAAGRPAPGGNGAKAAPRPALQAAFCIDVRSEVFRRALEAADPGIRTIGFAGFFGLAARHRDQASDVEEARAPVLLRPGVASASSADAKADLALRLHARALRAWGRFKLAAVSSFAFVEAAGPLYAAKLLGATRPHAPDRGPSPAPLPDMALPQKVAAAAGILRAMSLTQGFARVVLVAGHGATVTNAPHASALQCGACGGHAGDVNARLLAGLLNDPQVRAALPAEGIDLPGDTLFVAGLHDTVSDRVTLFADHDASGHAPDLKRLRRALDAAGAAARTERALRLPRAGDPEDLPRRGGDWAELRPEWGLAGCRAFIAAPRHRSEGRDLRGRAFLHSYDWRRDEGFATLELILTAPVVVASWIALQYHGSATAPDAFGAGNKLLHNVTGGIGVVEGNGGLLRAGLPWQSVHDGERLQHDPARLAVVIEAPPEAILAVLARQPAVAALFDNGWLSLHAMDDAGQPALRYDGGGGWSPTQREAPPLRAAG